MVSGTKSTPKKGKTPGTVKEKVFHPNSRKAGQLERASLRKGKLASASSRRSKKQIEKADRFGFWFHALPPDVVALTLAELHAIIRDSWLTRHDEAIQSEVTSRRPGRPPSKREVELRALKPQEEEEYRSGIELPDLTHERTVELFREWNGDPAYLHLLRFIRISSTDPEVAVVVRQGLQERAEKTSKDEGDDNESMEVDSTVTSTSATKTPTSGLHDVPLSKFSSTMLTMDA